MTEFRMTVVTEAGPDFYRGSQPGKSDLRALMGRGIRRVIDLRAATEPHGYDEAQLAHELGLECFSLPVRDEADLTREKVRALDSLLGAPPERPTLIHCASSNRVGALLALRAGWLQDRSREDALRVGRQAGLRGLESAVESVLTASGGST